MGNLSHRPKSVMRNTPYLQLKGKHQLFNGTQQAPNEQNIFLGT